MKIVQSAADPRRSVFSFGQLADIEDTDPEGGAVTLDARGVILDCDAPCERLFGYVRDQIIGRHLSMLLPELANIDLFQNGHLNDKLHFFCHIGRRFLVLHRDGARLAGRLFLTMIGSDDAPGLRVVVASPA
ncbi:PAS domain S-box protein [Parasulfuritortus cantonensis]|uniref:PAS domain S-box protein n=1 Tax=Parasulfuritortus cantonensis TaxID=2528202 RepID=A0A4R1B8I2_9PROT|nr:PAS domain S-box protein [Parasulfuritortus cantonensis]TCJ12975.1 PAS domain S-box protein [Parasulfuritortus cantonensis]